MSEHYLQSLDDLRRATGHAPGEEERASIAETLRKNTGWLEGYKATLEGQTTVPMAVFNRLAQDYEDTILYVARDRAEYEADAMVSTLSRDDQIKALQQDLYAIRPQETGQRVKELKSQLNALNEEVAQLRSEPSRCISLEAEVAELKEQADRRCHAVMAATVGAMRRAYDQRIASLEGQLEECESRRESRGLKMTALDAFTEKVIELRQKNAELERRLAECEDLEEDGAFSDAEYGVPEEECGDNGMIQGETDVHSEIGPSIKDATEAPAGVALQNEAAPDTGGPSQGYLVLKNAFATSQRLRVSNKEVAILQAKLEQAEENQRTLRENNVYLAPRLNRALRRLAARDSEIALLQAQVVEAENRAARNLAAVNGLGRKRTVDEELLKQWNDATERNNLQILTALADEDDMLATWKDDVQKLFRGYQNGQLTEESRTYSFDQMVPL